MTVQIPTKTAIYKAAKAEGLSKALIKSMLPRWWDDSLLETSSGFAQFVFFLKSRFGLKFVHSELSAVEFHHTKLQREFKVRTGVDESRLVAASLQLGAYARTLVKAYDYNVRPQNIDYLREKLFENISLTLEGTLELCRDANLPVLFVSTIASGAPRPAGAVFKFGERFAIVLSHRHKIPSIQLFILLHEIGHALLGHMYEKESITDFSILRLAETLRDEADAQEDEADLFALRALRGHIPLDKIISSMPVPKSSAELAVFAQKVSKEYGISAGHVVLSYGKEYADWRVAQTAIKFLESPNALEILEQHNQVQLDLLRLKQDDEDLLSRVL
ncbi:ImmA/IrrE family metallo-endopeptidase [Thiomicrospira pelophila]|uniref:ImmA/IrrE family metallo-endopeptidase n=1 Tax=Thiomicrospira pelophila TaxID=934 RepID=UPI0004A70E05|nr:ImmA/IrrE family metallo-endopeptidase [Thiomicrospira pelophila]